MDLWRHIANLSENCAKCGACMPVCPIYRATGKEAHSARGKLHLLARIDASKGSAAYADILSKCLLCGACRDICPRQIDIPSLIVQARGLIPKTSDRDYFKKYLARKSLSHPALLSTLAHVAETFNEQVLHRLPPESGLRLKLSFLDREKKLPSLSPSHQSPEGENSFQRHAAALEKGNHPSYFSGCLASHLYHEITASTAVLCKKLTGFLPATPKSQTCCGLASYAAGSVNDARTLAKKNITAFEDGSGPILTSCASCFSHLRSYPSLFTDDSLWRERALAFDERVCEYSTYFLEHISRRENRIILPPDFGDKDTVLYHDPCHLRFHERITKAPRQLLDTLLHCSLTELPNGPQCCGQGGLFHLAHTDLSHVVQHRLLDDLETVSPSTVLSTCSGCLLQLQQGLAARKSRIRVDHLGVFLAKFIK